MNYYNEFDKHAAQWLRNLIAGGMIPAGDVDEQSTEDVRASDLRGYTQCHFFVGIGGWSEALRLAKWPTDRPVWTGSCPCQSFSSAGKRKGTEDKRHLWPVWFDLIRTCRLPVVFGEQVDAAIRHGWLDLVSNDLGKEGYELGAAVLPACSVGAPHIRKRLFFMAHSNGGTSRGDSGAILGKENKGQWGELQDGNRFGDGGTDDSMANCCDTRPQRWVQRGQDSEWQTEHGHAGCHSTTVGVDNALPLGCKQERQWDNTEYDGLEPCTTIQNDWNRSDWIYCRDEKYRPIEPGTLPLADEVPGRMVKIRGYGNAIIPQVAAEVIKAGMAYLKEVMV